MRCSSGYRTVTARPCRMMAIASARYARVGSSCWAESSRRGADDDALISADEAGGSSSLPAAVEAARARALHVVQDLEDPARARPRAPARPLPRSAPRRSAEPRTAVAALQPAPG